MANWMSESNFYKHLVASGTILKAVNAYKRERGWRGDEWYQNWEHGLADEVEAAIVKLQGLSSRES